MKIVIAIDSFKGCLSSMEAGHAVKDGILKSKPDAEVIVRPLADGGEGTVDALIDGLHGERVNLTVTGPMGAPVDCYYGHLPKSNTAIIEMASAAGLTLVPADRKNPLIATTYGVGEMILHAIVNDCRNFIIGIGGSATNDGGIGMLKALGFQFLDTNGNDAGEGGQALAKTASINPKYINENISLCNFKVACDVTNPLCGKNGATYIYGPQKGVTTDIMETLDQGMQNYADRTAEYRAKIHRNNTQNNLPDYPGAGAAGGLGFAFLSYLNAKLVPGADLILDTIHLENELKDADIVITGEGRIDRQTAMGKAPIGVAKLAQKYGAKVLAFAGSISEDASICNETGIDAFFPILREITTLEEAMKPENARKNLTLSAEQIFRLL